VISPLRLSVWDVFFAGICSIHFHPKYAVDDPAALIRMCASIADLMMIEHDKRDAKAYAERRAD